MAASLVMPDRPPPGTPPSTPGALVTRGQLARVIGKSERTIRRWETTRLAPALRRGDDGTHRFDVARVREIIEVQERPGTADAYDDGETTATVFELFAQGIEPVDVVIRLKLPASAIEVLREKWIRLRGGYLVDGEMARAISVARRATIVDATSLLQNLHNVTLWLTRCAQCREEFGDPVNGGRGAAFCGLCAENLSVRAAELAAEQAATARAARQIAAERQRQDAAHEKASKAADAERRK